MKTGAISGPHKVNRLLCDLVLLQGLKNILRLFTVILNVFLLGSITGNQV